MNQTARNRPPLAAVDPPNPCPIRDVLDRVGDQWSLLALESLATEGRRFNELKRAIGDVSQHMLARTLRRLEQDGLVSRTVFPAKPPRVHYALTSLGRSLLGPMKALVQWADDNHAAIRAARIAFKESAE